MFQSILWMAQLPVGHDFMIFCVFFLFFTSSVTCSIEKIIGAKDYASAVLLNVCAHKSIPRENFMRRALKKIYPIYCESWTSQSYVKTIWYPLSYHKNFQFFVCSCKCFTEWNNWQTNLQKCIQISKLLILSNWIICMNTCNWFSVKKSME